MLLLFADSSSSSIVPKADQRHKLSSYLGLPIPRCTDHVLRQNHSFWERLSVLILYTTLSEVGCFQ